MKAVIVQAKYGPAALIHDRPQPQMREGYVLVKVMAAALNPADNIYMDYGIAEADNLLGCDYAGVIEELGPGVIAYAGAVKPIESASIQFINLTFDRCTRASDASQPENGTFAEYIMVKADIALHIPDNLSFEEAATTGVTILTTGRCFVCTIHHDQPCS
jgi:NADPH:quinone reductase-like Zn-dependent oxidoreductase